LETVEQSESKDKNMYLIDDKKGEHDNGSTSDIESPTNFNNEILQPTTAPKSMTLFDLIGNASSQMLNDVFTRSSQEKNSSKTHTQFLTKGHPTQILFSIEAAIQRMPDCCYQIQSSGYEIHVTKSIQEKILQCVIQIIRAPGQDEHMIECRRAQGNVFRYYEFFEEFQTIYQDTMKRQHNQEGNNNIKNNSHFHSNSKNITINSPSSFPLNDTNKNINQFQNKNKLKTSSNDKMHSHKIGNNIMPAVMEFVYEDDEDKVHLRQNVNNDNNNS